MKRERLLLLFHVRDCIYIDIHTELLRGGGDREQISLDHHVSAVDDHYRCPRRQTQALHVKCRRKKLEKNESADRNPIYEIGGQKRESADIHEIRG